MNNTLKLVLASALVTAAAIKAAPALADPGGQNVAVVQTSDLDLASEAGQRRLNARLANAAREVCGEASEADLVGRNAVRACRDAALASAHTRSARPQAPTLAVTASR